ncbi:MAG: hypothetical protein U0271_18065 [Polyangiaceae bacterium]
MKKKHLAIMGVGLALALIGGSMFIPVGGSLAVSTPKTPPAHAPSFDGFSDAAPGAPIDLLFIHHSCGGQLLADVGPDKGEHCIYETHPSGGGLRAALTAQGYRVHEASYDSAIGHDTDTFDWLPKFSTKLDDILRVDVQDTTLPDGRKNRIVVFKSCFPNNQFAGEGSSPGDPKGPALTVWNARATLTALLPIFAAHPETLFVYVTAPPNAPHTEKMPLYRAIVRALKGKVEPGYTAKQAGWAREFNDWVVSSEGWLAGYKEKNVAVFDYYGILTGDGQSNLSVFATDSGRDSHPSSEGNGVAAKAFVPFINRVARRAGIVDERAAATQKARD